MVRFQAARGTLCAVIVAERTPFAAKITDASREAGVRDGKPVIEVFASAGSSGSSVRAAARTAARVGSIDLVHLHSSQDFNALAPWLILERLQGFSRPVILQLHIWLSHSKRDPWHALAYRLVDEVWCSSEPARQSTLKALPIPERKTRILRYGRPCFAMEHQMLSRDQARRELRLPEGATVVGCVSRIDRGKGSAELVRGAARVMQRNPHLWLELVGGPTQTPEAIAFAKSLGDEIGSMPAEIRARIRLPGLLPESHRILKAFDVFALPTYRECFSLALMEAQLAGLPCIATNAGGSPELVREGRTGWLCEPESTDSFVVTLERALADRDRWSDFGTAARDRVRAEYDLDSALTQTLQGYEKLLSGFRLKLNK